MDISGRLEMPKVSEKSLALTMECRLYMHSMSRIAKLSKRMSIIAKVDKFNFDNKSLCNNQC